MDPSERAAALDKELAVVQDAVRKAVELRGSVRSVLDSWAAVHSSSERKEEASAELRELVGRVQEAATALQEVTGSLSREVDPRPSGAPKVAVSQQVVVASEEETGAASVLKEMHERCGLAGRTFRKMVTQRFPDLEREMWLWKRDLAWKTELVKRKMETKDEGWLRLERGIRQVCERSGEDLEICKDVLQMGDACRLRGLTVQWKQVFRCHIAIDWVPEKKQSLRVRGANIKAWQEPFTSALDQRRCSSHQVMQVVNAHINCALRRFQAKFSGAPDLLEHFLSWLCSYSTLFQAKCSNCSRLLAYHSDRYQFLVPTIRTLDKNLPYHIQCLPLGQA